MIETLTNLGITGLAIVTLVTILYVIIGYVWDYIEGWIKNIRYKKKIVEEANDYCALNLKHDLAWINKQSIDIEKEIKLMSSNIDKLMAMKEALDQANINIMTVTSEIADATAATRENTSLIRRLIYRLDNTKKTKK